ncbi:hypothetical protein BDP81DRAFT_10556 [Colletotrichum phormii]|uniref:Uncharacterized protein n=1 Tax=Colletotrichum phormii TaxID=359342 RepID=A0AAJ0ENQ0_9PEZI|nr:uncharacterized protein BDP81DRAFT_10556 [Colletotrichum phormii]KAK1655819.1 hypothetical protein BDP81DRAFT_10556 [Colletotrichum phormii]
MSLTVSNRFVGHQNSLGGGDFHPFPSPRHGSLMYSQQWPPTRPAVVQAQPQERETSAASLIPSHNSSGSGGNSSSSRQGTGPPRFGKPPDAAGGPASSSASAVITRGGAANAGPGGGGDIHSQGGANDGTFSAKVAQQQQPAPAPAAGIINPFDLSAAEPSQPRHVLVRVDGDTGFYLGNAVGRPAPQEFSLPTEVDGSRSVANGDQIQTGWSIDYYGLSRSRHEYGNGIGWRCQESEAVADAQGNFGWPRKYVCSICCLRWNAMPLPAKVIRGDVSQKDRIELRIPNPADARRDPGFSRPGCSELHYYLDHEGPGNEPCVRGLCQKCRPVSFLPDSQPTTHCCPPPVAEPGYLKEIYRCIMDNCPFLTDTRREMKAHLHSPRKNGHKSYLTSLAGRIEHGQPLSAIDKEIASRLMLMFNDRDARGQKSISQPINTVLGAEDVSSPAILREHTQWMSYLGLHTPELHRRDFWDPRTGGWYYREYNMDDVFEDACENVRIISHATGRPVKPSDFLWR